MRTPEFVPDIPIVDGWTSSALRCADEWRLQLPVKALDEVSQHLDRNGGAPDARVTDVEFPALHHLALRVREELAVGSGITWVRPTIHDSFTDSEWRGLFSIFSSLLGMAHRPMHLPDPVTTLAPELITVQVDGLVPDVIGTVRLSNPQPGHELLLANAAAVHDELERHAPDELRTLYRPVLHGPSAGGLGALRGPVFQYERSARCLHFRYDRRSIEHTHDLSDVRLSDAHLNAFDMLDKVLSVPELLAPVRPGRGDILLVNNRRVATTGLVNAVRPGVLAETRALRVVNPASTAAVTDDH